MTVLIFPQFKIFQTKLLTLFQFFSSSPSSVHLLHCRVHLRVKLLWGKFYLNNIFLKTEQLERQQWRKKRFSNSKCWWICPNIAAKTHLELEVYLINNMFCTLWSSRWHCFHTFEQRNQGSQRISMNMSFLGLMGLKPVSPIRPHWIKYLSSEL